MNSKNCRLCPRNCEVNRSENSGFCGAPQNIKVVKAYLHKWEEPCISGKNGSGTVFFSHCQLKCVFCQNYEISHGGKGKEISENRLAQIFLRLQNEGAHNINLVSPTPYLPQIINALNIAGDKLKIPVAFNSGGYENAETIKSLCKKIKIFMPDIKFKSEKLSQKYLACSDYFEKAISAVSQMISETGEPVFDENGIMQSGVIIRHLVMPGCYCDSIEILDYLNKKFGNKAFVLSLMSQYMPCGKAEKFSEINRRITTFEYEKVQNKAQELEFNGYCQQRDSANENYIPNFDFSGI